MHPMGLEEAGLKQKIKAEMEQMAKMSHGQGIVRALKEIKDWKGCCFSSDAVIAIKSRFSDK